MTPTSAPRTRRLRTTFIVAAALTMLAAAPASAASPTPYGVNLVKNGGAQNGTNNWDVINVSSEQYGSPGFPSVSEGNSIGGGSRFFWSGPDMGGSCDAAIQSYHFQGRGNLIDSGHIRVRLRAYLGTKSGDTDRARVLLGFRDRDNQQLTTPNSGQLAIGATNTNSNLVSRAASKIVPRKTRILKISLYTDNNTDADCDGYYDKVSVRISFVP